MPFISAAVAAVGAVVGAVTSVASAVGAAGFVGKALAYGALAFGARALAPKPKPFELSAFEAADSATVGPQARNTVLASSTAARWIVGRAKSAGFLAWLHEEGENILHMVIVVSEGPCEDLEHLYVDGESVTLEKSGAAYTGAAAFRPTASSDYRDKVEMWLYDGTQTAAPASLAAVDSTYWGGTRIGRGLCYIHVKLTQPNYGQNTNMPDYEARFWTAVPQLEFVMDGLKFTWPGQATPTHTRSAAAIRYWYETSRLARPASAIDTDSVTAAHTRCSAMVGSGSARDLRYAIDGVITSEDSAQSVLDEMDFAWQGYVAEIDGRLKFLPGRDIPDSEAKSLNTDEQRVEFLGARPAPALSDRVNAVTFRLNQSRLHDYLQHDIEEIRDDTNIARDGKKLPRDLGLNRLVSNPYTAARLMAIALRRARATATYSYSVAPGSDFANLSILPGDLVTVTDTLRGLSEARMIVLQQVLNTDWSVQLTLVDNPQSIYTDDTIVRPQAAGNFRISRAALLPGPVDGLTAVGVAEVAEDGTAVYSISVSWTARPHSTQIRVTKGTYSEATEHIGSSATIRVPEHGDWMIAARHIDGRYRASSVNNATATIPTAPLTPPAPMFQAIRFGNGTAQLDIRPQNRRDLVSVELRYNFDQDTAATPAAVSTEAEWTAASQLGRFPVALAALSDPITAEFRIPQSGAYRISGRLYSRSGRQSPIGDLGNRVLSAQDAVVWRGAWDATVTYAVNSLVSSGAGSWIATASNTNMQPSDTSQVWDAFAASGGIGPAGPAGAPGTGFNWRGAWDASTAYMENDIVEDEGSAWIATAASTNSQPSGASMVWDLYAQKGETGAAGTVFRWRGAWNNAVAYAINDLVRNDGSAWVAVAANTGSEPTSSNTNWNAFAEGGSDGSDGAAGAGFVWQGEWNAATSYAVRDLVHHNRSAWIATAANSNSEPSGTSAQWDIYAEAGERGADGQRGPAGAAGSDGTGYTWRGAWDNSTTYVANDIVRHNGNSWVCVNANTNSEPA